MASKVQGEGEAESSFGSGRQQFNYSTENLVAVISVERQRELRDQQAVLHSDVVTAATEFEGKIAFAGGESGKGRLSDERFLFLRPVLPNPSKTP
jgi:hypothetical protein